MLRYFPIFISRSYIFQLFVNLSLPILFNLNKKGCLIMELSEFFIYLGFKSFLTLLPIYHEYFQPVCVYLLSILFLFNCTLPSPPSCCHHPTVNTLNSHSLLTPWVMHWDVLITLQIQFLVPGKLFAAAKSWILLWLLPAPLPTRDHLFLKLNVALNI